MKVRITVPTATGSAKLTVVSCATLTVLALATVSACTNSPSSTAPAIFTPSSTSTHLNTGTPTGSPAPGASRSAKPPATSTGRPATSTGRPTATATSPARGATPTAAGPTTHAPAPSASSYPTGAPATGGGGTAGLQDGALFGLGAAAMLAGLGSLAYRRRLTRRR